MRRNLEMQHVSVVFPYSFIGHGTGTLFVKECYRTLQFSQVERGIWKMKIENCILR